MTSAIAYLLGLSALLAAACVTDWRRRVVPNFIPASLCALFTIGVLTGLELEPSLGLMSFGLGLMIGVALFLIRVWGGGDAKLFAGATLYLTLEEWPAFMLGTALAGGALALLILARPAWRADSRQRGLPYAIAIAFGMFAAKFAP